MDSAKLTAHSLRHTAITLALVGGATVQQAQAMARHANINTTMIYAHNLERMDRAAEDALSGLLD
jgi:integrase